MSDQGKYRIRAVAGMTGVAPATLRAWERRYGVPTPGRTGSDYRLYSEDDVDAIRRMQGLCAAGMAPSDAARAVLGGDQRPGAVSGVSEDIWAAAASAIVAAVVKFSEEKIAAEVKRSLVLGTAQEIYARIFAPAMREVGELWHTGAITVAQEHLVSQHVEGAVRNLLELVQPGDSAPVAIFACMEHEEHELPLRGVALAAAGAGLHCAVLGARTPPEALASAVRALHPAIVCLSATTPIPEDPEPLLAAWAAACRPIPWVIGGAAMLPHAGLVRALGGIAYPSNTLPQAGDFRRWAHGSAEPSGTP